MIKIICDGAGMAREVNAFNECWDCLFRPAPCKQTNCECALWDDFERTHPPLQVYHNSTLYMEKGEALGEVVWQSFTCKVGGAGPYWLDVEPDVVRLYKTFSDFQKFYANPPRGWGEGIETRLIYRIIPASKKPVSKESLHTENPSSVTVMGGEEREIMIDDDKVSYDTFENGTKFIIIGNQDEPRIWYCSNDNLLKLRDFLNQLPL